MEPVSTRKQLEADLTELKRMVLRLGKMAEESISKAIWALKNQDAELARMVLAKDDDIDDLAEALDNACMHFAARFQPLGEDLRAVTSIMHMAVDLERIGDYGGNIAKVAAELADKELIKPLIDIPRMLDVLSAMMSKALAAFDTNNAEMAKEVFAMDDLMDDLEADHEGTAAPDDGAAAAHRAGDAAAQRGADAGEGRRSRDERGRTGGLHSHREDREGFGVPASAPCGSERTKRTRGAVRDVPEARILIVEDEDAIMEIVSQALRRHGYETASASDGDAALEKVFSLRPDLVILDLMLPKMDGWEVCRRMRAEPETERIPILMLTARRDERDVVEGLELGADDYMKKPFSLAELTARVKALLRRTGERRESRIVENGDLRIELDDETALLRGTPLDLSPTEFRLLEALARKMGRTASREELLSKIWSFYGGDTRTVDVHISRLRKKLDDGKSPALAINSLRGRGYRLVWE